MQRLNTLSLLLLFTFFLSSCKTQTGDTQEDARPFNPYVEAFTTGKISRLSPVRLIFNKDVPAEKQDVARLKKRIKFKPDVTGEFSWEDSRTLVFTPTKALDRDTHYQMTTDISDWFPVSGSEKNFSFRFSTLPFRIQGDLESIKSNPNDASSFDIVLRFTTSDKEADELIESVIELSEKFEHVSWHHVNGKTHEMTLEKVAYREGQDNFIDVTIKKNKFNIPEQKVLTFAIPSSTELDVYDVTVVNDTERYIQVSFTQPLQTSQEMEGLIFLQGGSAKVTEEELVTVEGNVVKIYPATNRKGDFEVHISKEIKSANGIKLGKTVIEKVRISEELPSVELIGKGVIIPQSSELIVPFRAVHLRGVVVRVIRIMENNIGQFLQTNRLDQQYQLSRVGRLIARKTILLEEENVNLAQWNTFAIDLRELMEPEPGAIYRIELSFTKDLSAYPCANSDTQKTKEELLAEDITQFQQDLRQYDNHYNDYYYYYYDDYDYYYEDDSRKDPCSDRYYYNRKVGRNVLASNLGIIAKRGNTNEVLVVVNNILTTYPEKSVDITIHNYQNQVIGRGVTDEKGQTRIKIDSNGGVPFYIMASQGEQKSYLRVDDGASLSLSNFEVSGEVVQKGIKGFIYGDRGVWRPGDTLYMSFMLNDRDKTLPDTHPVVMELYNPNGQLYLKRTRASGEMGIYSFELPTDPDAPTGAWNIQVKVGGVTFYKRVRIESIKPNRLKINLAHSNDIILRGEKYTSKMHVEWLQGATARNLSYEIEGTFTAIPTTFPKYKDYRFDMITRSFDTETVEIAKGTTDEKGDADIEFKFELGSSASGMLSASLFTRVYEESGDFSIDGEQIRYSPYTYYAGIKSPKEDDTYYLYTDKEYTWELASVDHLGNPAPNRKLNVRIYKTERYWWWSSNSKNLANYLENSHNRPIKDVTVTTNGLGVGKVTLTVSREEWGSYFVVVKDEMTRHTAGVGHWIDWPGYGGRRDSDDESSSAQTLRFKTDKETYEPGETIRLTIPTAKGSRALVTIENGSKVILANDYPCEPKETIIEITATEEMLPNAYAHVTLLQPHANTNNDLPIRMYGVVPFRVNFEGSHLYPVIQMVDEVKPEQNYEVTISEKDGREMAYTLAIVDEGLLDLTRFKTPNPWSTFNAHEALGVTTWDIYNFIVGAYGGRIEQVFSIGGDDDLNAGKKAVVNRFKPVVKFDGPHRLKKGEKRTHRYIMPNYNGRVRVMVVAGDGSAYGNAEKSVMVRKPVMLLGTLPRVIGVGEEMVVPATVFATEDKVGKVKVSIACSDNMEIVGPSARDLNFTEKDDKQATFRIRVKNKPGAGKVTLMASGKGENSVYETDIEIRSVRRPQTRSKMVMVEPGKNWEEKVTMPGAAGTNKLTLEVSGIMPINLSSRLSYLIGYPHGCLEQITSKAFPQLYLKKFTELNAEQERITEQAVKDAIMRLRSYMMPSGAFAYWPSGTSSAGWASVYATHFMLEAEAMGYTVPDALKKNALKDLRQLARAWKPNTSVYYQRSEEFTQAYRLYVLSLAQTPEIGAMNRLKEQSNLYNMTRWTLAGAYALIGRNDVANTMVTTANSFIPYRSGYDYTYGSPLRDKAMRLQTLALLKKTEDAKKLAKEISESLSSSSWFSTQSTAFALLALSDFYSQFSVSDKIEFEYSTRSHKERIRTNSYIWSETLLTEAGTTEALKVDNKGNSTIFLQIITEGIPDQGTEEAYAKDVAIDVKYVDVNNQPIDIEELEQGVNFTAIVEVKNPTPEALQNLVLTQIFPAGWEILNTRFLEGASDTRDPGISYQDIRDDKVYSYIDYLNRNNKVTVKINLCSVYPGTFYLPPVWCEAMYDNQITANTEGKQVVIK